MDFEKALVFTDSLMLGATLLSLGESGATLDDIRCGVAGTEEVDRDDLVYTDSLIATYLDFIGVQEDTINNLFARRDETSTNKATAIVKKFLETYNEDDIVEIAKAYSNNDNDVELDEISLDMVARKAGYKRELAIRKGKKVWVNKRIAGKKIHLTPKQKQALVRARLKAHTAKAKMHRAKSAKVRKRYGLK